MGDVLANRIYDLKISGYDESFAKVQKLTAAFDKMDKAKRKLNEQLQKKLEAGDSAAVEELRKKISDLEQQLAKLSKEKERAKKETDLLLTAEQAYAKAELDAIKQIKEATKYTTELAKEKDKAAKASQKAAQANEVEAGSYRDVRNQLALLKPFIEGRTAGSTATIAVGGSNLNFDQAIAKFKQLSLAEQDFRRQFQADGTLVSEYSSGIINAFNKLGLGDLISRNRSDIQGQLRVLRTENEELAASLKRSGVVGAEGFQKIETQLRENIQLQEKLEAQLQTINTTLASTGSIGQRITKSIDEGFRSVKSQVASVVLQYIGMQAAIQKVQETITNVKLVSDQTTDLEIQLDNDAKAADNLTESLKKMNTRTTVAGLQEIADVALRAGTTKQNIEGVTRAIDVTKVAFGKDFGSVEQGTETFAKLVNIFYEDREITGDRILKIGNSIRALANETVASVPFINDFAGRMAGLRQISNITLPDVIGLGAGFEEFKQSAEVASTTLVKVIPKLAQDIDKFAKIAGVSNEEFKKLLTDTPIEALLKVSQGLVKGRGDVEEFANTLADAGLDAGRVTTIIGTLGGKADVFRERIRRAGETIQQTDAITSAFDKKNTNLAATMDKINKRFADVAASKQFQFVILAITSIIGVFLTNIGILLPLLLIYIATTNTLTGAKLRLLAATVLERTAWVLEKANLVLTTIARYAATTALNVYTAATIRGAAATGAAAVAYRVLAAAIALVTSPLGIAVALLTGLVTIFGVFSASARGASGAVTEFSKRISANNEINRKATELIGDQISKMDAWIAVIKSTTASADTKRLALDKLIEQSPRFQKALEGEKINLQELEKAYNDVTTAIKAKALADASASLSAEKQNKLLTVQTLRQRIETTFTSGKNYISRDELSDDEKKILSDNENRLRKTKDLLDVNLLFQTKGYNLTQQNVNALKKLFTTLEQESADEYQTFLKLNADNQAKFADIEQTVQTNAQNALKERSKTEKLTQAELQSLIDGVDYQLKTLREGDPKLKQLQKEREGYEDRLNKLLGRNTNTKPFGGSKLTGEQKDDFKNIDAKRDQDLADQKLKRAQNLIDEQTYLKAVLSINQNAIDEKLKLLKGATAEERKIMADLKLDRITIEQETNNKIFEERKKSLKASLDDQIKDLQQANKLVQEDPTISATDKAKKKQETDQAILNLTTQYGNEIAALEKQYGQQSIDNAKEVADAIRNIKEDLRKDEKDILEGELKDAEDAANKDLAQFRKNIEAQRLAVIKSNKPQRKKDAALAELKNQEDFGVLAREVARDTIEKEIYEKLLKAKIITQEQYDNFLAEAYKREQQLHDAGVNNTKKAIENVTTLGQLITSKLSAVFGFDNGTAEGQAREKLLAETIAQSYQLAQNAMNNFYEAEKNNIERSKQLAEKRIELEKQQALNTAQSQAERDAIEREAQVKKDKADREAFEKNKKIQIAQAKINLGIQLANLAVIAFAPNPQNIATLGIAGAVMYALQAAIAIANYASNVKRIQSAQYAGGGLVRPEDVKNGKIAVEPNIPVQPNGDNILATVKKGEVILNEDQQKKLGGPKTFKSIGVPGFAGGGMIDDKKYFTYASGGFAGLDYPGALGENLRAPVNPSEFLNPKNGGSSDMQELKAMVAQQTVNLNETARQIHERIDKIKVQVVAGEVEKTNNDVKKVVAMGTL